jgi:uncharacterized membrane protein YdbT with pleckstrin-like domain
MYFKKGIFLTGSLSIKKMGFKANFCCFCCCGMKPKKFTRAVAILFLIIGAILCIVNGVNSTRVTGAYKASPIVQLIIAAVTVVFSILVLIKIRGGNWGLVKGYGIFCLIANILSLILTIVSLILYLVVVGILGGGNSTLLGFALIIAIVPYSVAFLIHAWFIHLSYKVWKGADKMEEKEEEEKAGKKSSSSSSDEEKKKDYEAHPQHQNAYANQNPNQGYPQPEQTPVNVQPNNDYQA